MSKPKFLFVIAAILVAFSCKPTIPRQYIQPDELEDILYDYHLADAIAERNHNGENMKYNQLLYRQMVLKKHNITQADFDSTIVYYTRHSDKLHTIYENLTKRFSDEALALGASANDINQYGNIASEGDTANVWKGVKAAVLTADAPYNTMTFHIAADTTYHKGDRIILSFNSDFIFKEGIRDAIAMLAVQFSNDSVACNAMHISSNAKHNVSVSDNERLGIKSIRGFFYLPKDSRNNQPTLRVLSITNVSMVRFHTKEEPKEEATTPAKQAKPDSIHKGGATQPPLPTPRIGRTETADGRSLPHSMPTSTSPKNRPEVKPKVLPTKANTR